MKYMVKSAYKSTLYKIYNLCAVPVRSREVCVCGGGGGGAERNGMVEMTAVRRDFARIKNI